MNKEELFNFLKRKRRNMLKNIQTPYNTEWRKGWYEGFGEALKMAIAQVYNLEVPEKPTVPRFVTNWIKENKDEQYENVLMIGYDLECGYDLEDRRVLDWIEAGNENLFAKAYVDYPQIEVVEEKKYILNHGNKFIHTAIFEDNEPEYAVDIHVAYTDSLDSAGEFTEKEKYEIQSFLNVKEFEI